MACTIHLSLEPGEAPVGASHCNSSCVTIKVVKRPSPISSPSISTINASSILVLAWLSPNISTATCSPPPPSQGRHQPSGDALRLWPGLRRPGYLKVRSLRSSRAIVRIQFSSCCWSIATAHGTRPRHSGRCRCYRFQKKFRVPLRGQRTERLTVARHQSHDLVGHLSKVQQCFVHLCL